MSECKSKGFRFSPTILFTIIALGAIALVSWKPLAITYHRYQLGRIGGYRSGHGGYNHVEALPQLGFYEMWDFHYVHIVCGSPDYCSPEFLAFRSAISDFRHKHKLVHTTISEEFVHVTDAPERMSILAHLLNALIDAHDKPPSDAAN
jgi:hypothetical protein